MVKTLDPGRRIADPDEMHILTEMSDWTLKIYEAEHAIAKAEDGTPGITGTQGQYRWLTSVDHTITDLLRLCPEVLLGKRLAVTSIDSGALRLTEEETNAGWWTRKTAKSTVLGTDGSREDREDWKIANSPILHSVHGLPNETHDECCGGFDEWHVFDNEVRLATLKSS